jgi:hypothetical protein
LASDSLLDSLRLRLVEIDIANAQTEFSRNSFWRRLIPRVTLSASFGVRDLISADPVTGELLPRDSYRLHLSLSLSDLVDASGAEIAESRFLKLRCEQEALLLTLRRRDGEDSLRRVALRREIGLVSDERQLVERLVEFYETKFEQGSAEFNTLVRARLELIDVNRSINRLHTELRGLQR